RQQSSLCFPLTQSLDIRRTVLRALHTHNPFVGHPLDHPASCIQNPVLDCNETAVDRRSLLRLPVLFRHTESLEFSRRTDQRHFRFYKNAAINGETFAT